MYNEQKPRNSQKSRPMYQLDKGYIFQTQMIFISLKFGNGEMRCDEKL